jgi:hypothetical protein
MSNEDKGKKKVSGQAEWNANPRVTMEIQREIAWKPNEKVVMFRTNSQETENK